MEKKEIHPQPFSLITKERQGQVSMEIVYISIGSNIGDGLENCRKGIAAIEKKTPSHVLDRSRFYRTAPVDYTDQNWFVNAAIKIATDLSPIDLFHALKAIEREAGTLGKEVRFGPRILDLDILLYGRLVLDSNELIIPHPRMDKRRFVLEPLCDIDAEIEHPILKEKMGTLLSMIKEEDQKVMVMDAQ